MESLLMITGDDDDCVNSADGTIAERTWRFMYDWLQNLLAYYILFNSLLCNKTNYYNYVYAYVHLYTLCVCDCNLESLTIWMYSGVFS